MSPGYKTVPFAPMTCVLDNRCRPLELAGVTAFRFKENWDIDHDGNMRRGSGFQKAFSKLGYNNEDFHDQLLPLLNYYDAAVPPVAGANTNTDIPPFPPYAALTYCGTILKTRTGVREPITFGREVSSQAGLRFLYIASQTRIARLNQSTGNWAIIADGLGGTVLNKAIKFTMGQVGGSCVFTNNFDKPILHEISDKPMGCNLWRGQNIPELDDLGLTQAAIAIDFNNTMFLMNTVEKGVTIASRVRWSGNGKVNRWKPGADTTANFQDLPYDELILNAIVVAGSMYILTNKSIWRVDQGADSQGNASYSFITVYREPRNLARCLVYPFTLTSTGSAMYYVGRDDIYRYQPGQDIEPVAVEFIHQGTGDLFAAIDKTCCNLPVMDYKPDLDMLILSYPEVGYECLNNRTFKISLTQKAQTSSYFDMGFTMFTNFRSDERKPLREWLIEHCVCTAQELNASGLGYVKEGQPSTQSECDPDLAFDTIDEMYCALFTNDCVEGCNEEQLLIGASSVDYCLKQLGTSYNREFCTNPTAQGIISNNPIPQAPPYYSSSVGTYRLDGYYSTLRWMWPLAYVSQKKQVQRILVEVEAETQQRPCAIQMRIGVAYGALDVNKDSDRCRVKWRDLDDRNLACPQNRCPDNGANLIQNLGTEWAVFEQGRFLYGELKVANQNGSPATGGSSFWAAMYIDAAALPT